MTRATGSFDIRTTTGKKVTADVKYIKLVQYANGKDALCMLFIPIFLYLQTISHYMTDEVVTAYVTKTAFLSYCFERPDMLRTSQTLSNSVFIWSGNPDNADSFADYAAKHNAAMWIPSTKFADRYGFETDGGNDISADYDAYAGFCTPAYRNNLMFQF